MKTKILFGVIWIVLFVAETVLAQTVNEAISRAEEAKTIFDSAKSKEDNQRTAQKYEEALKIFERIKLDKGTGHCSNQLGVIHFSLGQYQKLQKEDVRNPSGKLLCSTTTRGNTLKCEVRRVNLK